MAKLKDYLGNKYIYFEFDSIDSTSTFARNNLQDKDFIVTARKQTAGRGRTGKKFFSNGGIYFTVGIYPNEQDFSLDLITIISSLAVSKALFDLYQIDTKIKWVNDVYYQDKKAVGILSELIRNEKTNSNCFLLGIGLNVNLTIPEELKDIANEIKIPNVNVEKLIANIVIAIEEYLKMKPNLVIEEYKKKMFLINKVITFNKNNQQMTGKVLDINEKGHLLIDCDSHKIELSSGEISIGSRKINS